jgi:uncharacterized membrane protein (UPF0182 family)
VSFDFSASMSPDSAQPKPRRRGGVLLPTIIVLGLIVISFVIFTGFYTDWLWFGSVDKSEVFTTTLITRVSLFLGFGLLAHGTQHSKKLPLSFDDLHCPSSPL